MNLSNLKGKTAIVTGGSRGIGRAIVLMLAKSGCNVAFSYFQNDTAADSLKEEIQALGVTGRGTKVDIKDFGQVKEWIEGVKVEFGRLDILINNAGIIADKALMLMSPEDWEVVVDTNLNGVFHATKLCIFSFMKQKSGDIINISSVSGVMGLPRQTNYSASKGGVNAFTKALAKEVSAYGIRVNAVAPGYIETEILSGFTAEQKQQIESQIPLGRIGQPEDVANCVRFLLSEQSQYVTGQVICVDGGLTMR